MHDFMISSVEAVPGSAHIILCPRCAKGIRLAVGQLPDHALKAHAESQACDPTHYEKVRKRSKTLISKGS
jgi:hypothetical protein